MFCPKCGNRLNETQSFCPQCGASVNNDQATVSGFDAPVSPPAPEYPVYNSVPEQQAYVPIADDQATVLGFDAPVPPPTPEQYQPQYPPTSAYDQNAYEPTYDTNPYNGGYDQNSYNPNVYNQGYAPIGGYNPPPPKKRGRKLVGIIIGIVAFLASVGIAVVIMLGDNFTGDNDSDKDKKKDKKSQSSSSAVNTEPTNGDYSIDLPTPTPPTIKEDSEYSTPEITTSDDSVYDSSDDTDLGGQTLTFEATVVLGNTIENFNEAINLMNEKINSVNDNDVVKSEEYRIELSECQKKILYEDCTDYELESMITKMNEINNWSTAIKARYS